MTRIMLPPNKHNLLGRLLGMLGSTFDGEVVNAGRAADKLVRSAGLTWPDIINPPQPPPQPPPGKARWPDDDPDPSPVGADWRRTAAACLRFPMLLNKWEFDFLSGLPRFPRISKKQSTTLSNIVTRMRNAGCGI